MKNLRSPRRWSDPDSGAPDLMTRALQSMRQPAQVDATQLEALRQRIASALEHAAGAVPADAPGPLLSTATGKLLIGLLAAGAIGTVYLRSAPAERHAVAKPTQAAPPQLQEPVAHSAAPSRPKLAPQLENPALAVTPDQPRERARRVRNTARPAAERSQARAPAAPSESESKLIGSGQRALRSDPRAALALAQRHAALHPEGALSQERELLRFDALVALGERAAAHVQAKRFLQRYPRSSHSLRLRGWLERAQRER